VRAVGRRRGSVAAIGAAAVVAAIGGAAIAGAFEGAEQARPSQRGAGQASPSRRDSATAVGRARTARAILVLTQTYGYRHASIPVAADALRRLEAADRRLRLVFVPGAQSLTPGRLRGAAAVMFLLTTGELPLSPGGKRDLLAFVHRGGALIGFHSATDTFHGWPAYMRMIGAEFVTHPLPSTKRVIVEDRHNPATQRLPARFSIHEEFYEFRHDPRPRVHVLARLDTGYRGPDRPLVWCRRDGHGRVFYDALGHFGQTWHDRRQLDLARGGITWAVGLAPGRC
jgi:hypothetical protein